MITLTPPFSREDSQIIRQILLENNGSIVYPTETYYALGCAATSSSAVETIYTLKKRDHHLPLLVLIDSWSMLYHYVNDLKKPAVEFLQTYWPGPLTAILHHNGKLAMELNRQGRSVGFRMSSAPIARELIGLIGEPLVGTSANKSSEEEASDCMHAKKIFGSDVAIYIDGGKTPGILPSTLIDMTTETYTVVRKGLIPL